MASAGHWESWFLTGRLSRPVKKKIFLCDLCASVVNK
jgi:hypothetical protein